ncbi:MAG: sel1 repeat family protein [Alphaproteobacteria bacterium]|nr:sel1 repeat family protein [Alphaproteobacteria bacterium]
MFKFTKITRNLPIAGSTFIRQSAGLAAVFLLLTACETPLLYKSGGQALAEGDQTIIQSGDFEAATKYYEEALKSRSLDIQGQAAYNLAMIAKDQGDEPRTLHYLEQAHKAGYERAGSELLHIYKRQGYPDKDIRALSIPLAENSASASLNLLEISLKENRPQDAARYALQTEKLILEQIKTEGDPGGNKNLMVAHLYNDHRNLFAAPKDPEPFYRRAIERGNVQATQDLADLWIAEGTRPNLSSDAFALMLQAAQAGDQSAMKFVTEAYENGQGTQKDIGKSLEWYQKLEPARQKASSAQRFAHEILAQGASADNEAKAMSLFESAADKNSLEAMLMYDGLKGGTPKYKNAYARQPSKSLYSAVKGLEKQYGKARPEMIERQYLIAANAGSGEAALYLAKKAESLPAGKRNDKEINKWYKKAAELGAGDALLIFARRAKIGVGQEPNDKEAFKWFLKAAEAGMAEGQYETGNAYARGLGVEQNREKARYWLEQAQKNGYVLAIDVLEALEKE